MTKVPLPKTLTDSMFWIMVSKEKNGLLTVLVEESRFILQPIVTNDGVGFYVPQDGWLEVNVTAFDRRDETIVFRVYDNTLPGVGLKKMMTAYGHIEDADDTTAHLMVDGLTFDGQTTVEWTAF